MAVLYIKAQLRRIVLEGNCTKGCVAMDPSEENPHQSWEERETVLYYSTKPVQVRKGRLRTFVLLLLPPWE